MDENSVIVEIIKNKLLTPVIYKIKDADIISVVGFFDKETSVARVYDIQSKIEFELDCEVHIYDFRDFEEFDRMEIIKKAELIYSEDDMIKAMFEAAMAEDLKSVLIKKRDAVMRAETTGTAFIS